MSDKDKLSDFEGFLKDTMDLEEMHFALLSQCKSPMHRSIFREIADLRPGWVINVELAANIEDYIVNKHVWSVDNPDAIMEIDHSTMQHNEAELSKRIEEKRAEMKAIHEKVDKDIEEKKKNG